MPDAFSSHPVSLPADMLLASCDRLALLLFLRPVPARRAAGLAQLPGLLLPPTLGGLGGSLLGEGGMTGRLGSEVSAPPLPGSLLSTSFLLDLEWSSTPLWRLLLFVLLSLVLLSLSLSPFPKDVYSCQGLGPKWNGPSLPIHAHPVSPLCSPRNVR